MPPTEQRPARERILEAAMQRYYAEGIRAVSADKLIADAGVSKVTFYRHFPTKDDLVAAYLETHAQRECDALNQQRTKMPTDPAGVLLWYAGAVGAASCSPGSRGCPFINAAAELSDATHPGRIIISTHRAWLTNQLAELLDQLDSADSHAQAEQIMMLRDGAMVSGYLGQRPEQVSALLVNAIRSTLAYDRRTTFQEAGETPAQ